uniref:Uncharacterized protein n=1 Tax=Strongyloides venezuelensis TaxID=75913 RepID=A0A0K0G5E9_STRVS
MVRCLYEVNSDEIFEKDLFNYDKHYNISSPRIFGFQTYGLIVLSIGILSELGKFNYFKTSFSLLKNGSATQALFVEAICTMIFLIPSCIVMFLIQFFDYLHKHLIIRNTKGSDASYTSVNGHEI